MSAVILRRIDPERDMCEWGRIGRPGTVRTFPCLTEAEALAALEHQRPVKERRG